MSFLRCCAFPAAAFFLSGAAFAQFPGVVRPLITEPVNPAQLVTLHGNTRSAANSGNDAGRVADNLPLDHMLLQLQRSPAQEQALDQFLSSLNDPNSPNFHKWLTAAQFGQQFGLSSQDLTTITNWLEQSGFVVNVIYPSGMLIDFSGTAGQVRQAFHTEIHNLNVNGAPHIANMSDPQIPAALAPAVAGVVSLHDFTPHRMIKPRTEYTFTSGGSTYEAVVPSDLATSTTSIHSSPPASREPVKPLLSSKTPTSTARQTGQTSAAN